MQATLAATFAELRSRKSLTLLQIASKCDLSETTVLKIEQGKRPVRWETVHLALSVGMGVQPGMDDYEACRALWWADRQRRAETRAKDSGRTKLSTAGLHALAVCRKIIGALEESEIKRFEEHTKRFKSQ